MKRLSSCIVALLLVAGLASAQTLKVGIFDLKPHLLWNEGSKKADGAAVKYLTAIADKAGVKLDIQIYPFPRLIKMLYDGELDICPVLSKNPDRIANLTYADEPFLVTRSIFMVKSDSPIKEIRGAADLKGLKIGYLQGANLGKLMRDNASLYTLDALAPENYATLNFTKLLGGRIDAIYDLNDVTMVYEAKRLGHQGKVRVVYLPDVPGELFIAASKKSAAGAEFIKKVNELAKGFKYESYLAPYIK